MDALELEHLEEEKLAAAIQQGAGKKAIEVVRAERSVQMKSVLAELNMEQFRRVPLYTSNAAAGMVLLMLPEFFFALYEKNGMHLETILTNFISVRFKRPAVRRYEVENLYERELETATPIQKKGGILGKK